MDKGANRAIFCRFPAEMVALLDAAAKRFSVEERIASKVTRSDVIRKLVSDGLANISKEGTTT